MRRWRPLMVAVLCASLAMTLGEGTVPACQEKATHVSPEENRNWTSSVGRLNHSPAFRTTLRETVALGWHQEAYDAQHTGYSPQDVPLPWTFKWQWNGSCANPTGSDCRPEYFPDCENR